TSARYAIEPQHASQPDSAALLRAVMRLSVCKRAMTASRGIMSAGFVVSANSLWELDEAVRLRLPMLSVVARSNRSRVTNLPTPIRPELHFTRLGILGYHPAPRMERRTARETGDAIPDPHDCGHGEAGCRQVGSGRSESTQSSRQASGIAAQPDGADLVARKA